MEKEELLILRAKGLGFCKTYEKWLIAIGKFMLTVYMLGMITHKIGQVEILTKSYAIMGIGVLSMLLPSQYILGIVVGVIVIHLLATNILIAGIAIIVGIVLYGAYIRLWPKESVWILLTWAVLGVEGTVCIIPIIAGLFCNLATVGAIVIGVFIYYLGNVIETILQTSVGLTSYTEMLKQSLQYIENNILFNEEMFSIMIIVMIVFLTVYLVKKQPIDYAPYIAIMLGGFMMVLGFGLAILFLNNTFDILSLILITCISVVLSILVQTIVMPLDYTRTETVQFEDEENIYYVKIVPKVGELGQTEKVEHIYTLNRSEQEEMF